MYRPPPAVVVLSLAAVLAAACGGAPTGTAGADESPTAPVSRPTPPVTPPGGANGHVDSGASIRLVNVWAEPERTGPSVAIRVWNEDVNLLGAAPGEESDFAAVPKAQIGDSPAMLEVVRSDATADDGRTLRLDVDEQVTVIAHASPRLGGDIGLGTFLVRERSWPSDGADRVTLLVYPGALQPLPVEVNGIALATTDGECLLDEDGAEFDGGWGGNIPMSFLLEPGTTEIAAAFFPRDDCDIEATMGTVTITGEAGQRFALVPWGPSGEEIELLVIDMGEAG